MMNFAPKKLSILFISIIFVVSSCGGEESGNANNAQNKTQITVNKDNQPQNSGKDSMENLALLVKLPFEPEDVAWREEPLAKQNGENRLPSQNERKLTAVLKFLPEDSAKIIAQAETLKAAQPVVIPAETWFPAEMIAQSELSGDETLKGNSYAANDFFQAPYLDGRLIRMENSNYFVLELFSK